jgi:hypothetical protein
MPAGMTARKATAELTAKEGLADFTFFKDGVEHAGK